MGYWIVYILFLISLLSIPVSVSKYLSLIFISVALTILFFYQRRTLTLENMKNLAMAVLIFSLFAVVVMFLKKDIMIFWIGLWGAIPYAWFLYKIYYKKLQIKQEYTGGEERRLAVRTNLSFEVELLVLDGTNKKIKGLTRDISTTGMRVFVSENVKKGDVFYFRIYVPEENWPLTGKVEVVWVRESGNGFECGMVFTEISEQDRGKIALKQGFSIVK